MTYQGDPRKRWFDVPDSKSKDGEDAEAYYNVEARFADHKVIDPASSHRAGHAVYQLVPQLHMHVKRNAFGKPAIRNSTSVVFQFWKGRDETAVTGQVVGPTGQMVPNREGKNGLPKVDIDRLVALIQRCREAWDHYQTFRQSPVWPLEEEVLRNLSLKDKADKGVHLVVGRTGRTDKDGNPVYDLVEYNAIADDEDDNFDPDGDIPEGIVIAQAASPATVKAKPGRKPRAAQA